MIIGRIIKLTSKGVWKLPFELVLHEKERSESFMVISEEDRWITLSQR